VGAVFGWVFFGHQIGAALASYLGGIVRVSVGDYTAAFLGPGCWPSSPRSWSSLSGARPHLLGLRRPERREPVLRTGRQGPGRPRERLPDWLPWLPSSEPQGTNASASSPRTTNTPSLPPRCEPDKKTSSLVCNFPHIDYIPCGNGDQTPRAASGFADSNLFIDGPNPSHQCGRP
jgi:hypothetical protein